MAKRKRDRATRFIELKRQVIANTGLSEDSPRVAYLAVLALRAERITEAAINDDEIDVAELLAIKDTIEQMSPEPTHNIEIQYCKRLFGVCQFCHRLNQLDEYVGGPPLPQPPRLLPPPSGNGADHG